MRYFSALILMLVLAGCAQTNEPLEEIELAAPISRNLADTLVIDGWRVDEEIYLSVFDGQIFPDAEVTVIGSMDFPGHQWIRVLQNNNPVDVTDTLNHPNRYSDFGEIMGFSMDLTLQEGRNTLYVSGLSQHRTVYREINLFYDPSVNLDEIPLYVKNISAPAANEGWWSGGGFNLEISAETQAEIFVELSWDLDTITGVRVSDRGRVTPEVLVIDDYGITFVTNTMCSGNYGHLVSIFDIFGRRIWVNIDVAVPENQLQILSVWVKNTGEYLIPETALGADWQAHYDITEPTEFVVMVSHPHEYVTVLAGDSLHGWMGSFVDDAPGVIPVTRDGDVFRFTVEPCIRLHEDPSDSVHGSNARSIHISARDTRGPLDVPRDTRGRSDVRIITSDRVLAQ